MERSRRAFGGSGAKRLERGIFANGKRARGRMSAMPSGDDLFKGRHFDRGIVVLRARWRPRYKLGWRNLVETMAEPDVSRSYDASCAGSSAMFQNSKSGGTASRVQVRGSWRVDETYDKSRGVGHISAAPWTKPERPWISSFVPSEMSPPPRCFFVGRSRTRVDRRARSRSRAIKLRVGLLVRFSNSTARGDYDQPHRTHASPQEMSIRPEQTQNLWKKPRPRFGARRSAP